jgi:SAM-dependent methyltransferase
MFGLLKRALTPTQSWAEQETLAPDQGSPGQKKVLNVGGNSKEIPIPPEFDGWQHLLLDIDPTGNPDIVCDARNLTDLPPATFDCVYCSHNLEHYFAHDVVKVLTGFIHVLKEDGFACIRVPDIGMVMQTVVRDGLDIDDVLYQSGVGPISVKDVLYGYGVEIAKSGNDFFAHKTGFTTKSLAAALVAAGFDYVFTRPGTLEIAAFAFKNKPNDEYAAMLNITELN